MLTAVFLVDGLLIFSLLWVVVRFLHKYREYITSTIATQGLSKFVWLLMAAPPPAIVIIAIVVALFMRNELFLNFAHASFLLGMWIATITLGVTFLIVMRIRSPYLFIAFLGILAAMLPVLFFTSTISFQSAFAPTGTTGYLLLLLEGLAIIAFCYPMLLRLYHIFKTTPIPSTRRVRRRK
ncbi:MAG TPA: hypothetical protein VKV40_19490 [Ktedonobacteraceae bacterium]|nr:hypothetical protein [Ktedonobacteraceae bacterium]